MTLRFTTAERALVEQQAAEQGITAAEYLRACVLDDGPRQSFTDAAAVAALNRVGVSLETLAEHAANGGAVPELKEAVQEVRAAVEKVLACDS